MMGRYRRMSVVFLFCIDSHTEDDESRSEWFYVSGPVIKTSCPPWVGVLWELDWFRLRRTGKAESVCLFDIWRVQLGEISFLARRSQSKKALKE